MKISAVGLTKGTRTLKPWFAKDDADKTLFTRQSLSSGGRKGRNIKPNKSKVYSSRKIQYLKGTPHPSAYVLQNS